MSSSACDPIRVAAASTFDLYPEWASVTSEPTRAASERIGSNSSPGDEGGDFRGRFATNIRDDAIRDIGRKGACPAAGKVLQDGLLDADALDGWSGKAWALRDAFDGLLEVINRTERP